MKLRWVAREERTAISYHVDSVKKVKVLQYWDAVDNSMQYGRWVDVPLEVEE